MKRFWDKVDVRGATECWPWLGAKNPSGHGRFWLDPVRRNTPAHRFMYEHARKRTIPEGLHLDHLCENPSCVNPWHLEPVTLWENLRRSANSPAVINAAKTHCKRGHEFNEENTYFSNQGRRRRCRACRRKETT